jgi:hypothetical protein
MCAFEEEVFEKVGNARLFRGLIGGTGFDPESGCYGMKMRQRLHQYSETVG